MADQERANFCIFFFAVILCALRSFEMLITLLSELIWVSNQKLVLIEAFWSWHMNIISFITYYSMFHVTWTTFKFNRSQLETVSAFVMISVPWSNQRPHQVIDEKLLSKEFHCRTTDHK